MKHDFIYWNYVFISNWLVKEKNVDLNFDFSSTWKIWNLRRQSIFDWSKLEELRRHYIVVRLW